MSYLALYRKYRPKTFDQVVDQEHITNTLINQIKSDKIGHAYLFCGSRGTGKTTTAKIFAKAINCLNPNNGSPCGKCEVCTNLKENNFDILEIDAASNNGVDEIRELKEQIKYPPVNGKYKVYIIDEVHMLSPSAFNALLKTLEEPPKYVVFILATTEVHKLPATILSRCMRFDFKLVSTDKIVELLKSILVDSKIEFEDKALQLIARSADGGVRDALSLTDMVISYTNNNLSYNSVVKVLGSIEKDKLFNIAEGVLNKNLGAVLLELDQILSSGKPALALSKDLICYFRDLLVLYTLPNNFENMVVAQSDLLKKMQEQAVEKNYKTIIKAIENLSTVEQELRYSVQPKIVLETALVKTINVLSLEDRVDRIEKYLQVKPEDKKKISPSISQIKKRLNLSADAIYGDLLKNLRENSQMQLYSTIISLAGLKLVDNCLQMDILEENIIANMDFDNDKYLKDFFDSKNLDYKINIVKSEEQKIIEGLKLLIGEKLKIKE